MFSAVSDCKELLTQWNTQQCSSPCPCCQPHPTEASCFWEGSLSEMGTLSATAAVSLCLELREPDKLLALGCKLNSNILQSVRTAITLVYVACSHVAPSLLPSACSNHAALFKNYFLIQRESENQLKIEGQNLGLYLTCQTIRYFPRSQDRHLDLDTARTESSSPFQMSNQSLLQLQK